MHTPLRIAFQHLNPSPGIVEHIRHKVDWLERFCSRITGCQVLVTMPHRHHTHGNQYAVRVSLTMPETEIVINREPTPNQSHQSLWASLRDAFDSARRQLQEHVRRRRGG